MEKQDTKYLLIYLFLSLKTAVPAKNPLTLLVPKFMFQATFLQVQLQLYLTGECCAIQVYYGIAVIEKGRMRNYAGSGSASLTLEGCITERGSGVEGELLAAGPCVGVPDDRGPVHASRQDVLPVLVPLQRKDRALVLA